MYKPDVPRNTYYTWGVMDSGKSTTLLQDAYGYNKKGWEVVVVKPGVDSKGENKIVSDLGSHLSREVDLMLHPTDDIVEVLADLVRPDIVKAVYVDEVQFITTGQATDLKKKIAVGMGTPVLTYGLLKDFRNEFFPASELYWNDPEVIKRERRSICYCGDNSATVNVRRVNGQYVFEGPQVAIEEGPTVYETYCEWCFDALRNAILSGQLPTDAPAGALSRQTKGE